METAPYPLVGRLEAALLEALPPLHRKIRGPAVTALAHRICRLWRPAADVTAVTLIPALRDVLRALEHEVSEIEGETAAFLRAINEAADEDARREVLIAHLHATVPDRRERRKDLKALKRWMGPDALRERLERRRQLVLVQEETALRALKGVLRATRDEDRSRIAADLQACAVQLLERALSTPRPQNQLAALETLTAALRLSTQALARAPEALATLGALVDRPGASPWLQASALEALTLADPRLALDALRRRLSAPSSAPRDFLFRRQALENAARLLPPDQVLALLSDAARLDASEYVRIGICELLIPLADRTELLRRLAGVEREGSEGSPRVRSSAVLAAAAVIRDRLPGWEDALELLSDVLFADADPLVLRVTCDQAALLADELAHEAAAEGRERLAQAVVSVKQRPTSTGAVLESAAAADLALARVSDGTRRKWGQFLAEAVRSVPSGSKVKITVEPPPQGLPPLPNDPNWLGALLAHLSQDDFGLYAERDGKTLHVWRGDQFERRAWRIAHELSRPAPNKRQGHKHTVGRKVPGTLRAHPAHMDEITATTVPGERVHVAQAGSWGRHLPTVDDLLDLPLLSQKPVQIFSSHGVTTVTPPASLSRRIKNRLTLTRKYENLAAIRLDSLRGNEVRERRRFVESVERELGVAISFTPYREGERAPAQIATLFGGSGAAADSPRSPTTLHSLGLFEAGWLATLSDVLMERNDYFFGTRGNGILALALFTAGAFSYFLADAYRKREGVREARARIPLCIGGWGTRGKSGTERLKAALFNGLGFEVFAKTTGSEAMFVHASPGGASHEFFIYRPYDKATIWEQRDMAALGARLGVEVFLWECMALQPSFVELLQNDWMHDDLATLTNAYPDHEDIQGPAGHNVAQVITNFMPEGGKVITSEDHFLPLFKDAAKQKGTTLIHTPWWEAELIPEELLALFPYREHPRNMALVATMAEQLGVPRAQALGLMAEHVQPEIGVLKVFPPSRVRGRVLSFINGHSANERTGFLNNWKRTGLDNVDPNLEPGRAVITVINNRWDRVARSEVFARIMVEDASADAHVLIGTNIEGLQKYVRDALDEYLSRREVVAQEDLQSGPDGLRRAAERLAREMAHLKVPEPKAEHFEARVRRYAQGAALEYVATAGLTSLVERALSGEGESLDVADVKAELRKELERHLDESLSAGTPIEDPKLPEVVELPQRSEVIEHATALLARMTVHARLRRKLPRTDAIGDVRPLLDAYHKSFRAAWKAIFLEKLVPVHDAQATGDQVVNACARSVPPGLEVSIMGAQNIKGTGLDWVYRWLALDKVSAALKAIESGTQDERRRAIETLETFEDNGIVDTALAQSMLPILAEQSVDHEESQRLRMLADRLRAKHEVKLAALENARSGSRGQRVIRTVEKIFDYLDSVRRRGLAEQLVDDLVHGRVSHARAALETRKLYERQKGGWLFANLRKKKAPEVAARPRPTLPAPSAIPTAAREAFARALEVPHDTAVKVPVAEIRPGSEATVNVPRPEVQGGKQAGAPEERPAASGSVHDGTRR